MRSVAGILAFATSILLAGPGPSTEDLDFEGVFREAGNSSPDLLRLGEAFLAKYPQSPRRPDLERALARAAVEAQDSARTILYGERALAQGVREPLLLERVAQALLARENAEPASRALLYAQELESLLRKSPPKFYDQHYLQVLAHSVVLQARAWGYQGRPEQALSQALRAREIALTAEAAREAGHWLARLGRHEEAVDRYAEAFVLEVQAEERSRDRQRLHEEYLKLHSSEAGLGERILLAYDRTASERDQKLAAARLKYPNAGRTRLADFVLSALSGPSLALSSLKGKVAVLDFWATWCTPCRAQQPLYEQLRRQFAHQPDVVFLSINMDDNREAVRRFVEEVGWAQTVYFEDGLAALLRITSVPTTIVIGRDGSLMSRMDGFVAETFVEQLSARIRSALAEPRP